jgi:hypothetical protein
VATRQLLFFVCEEEEEEGPASSYRGAGTGRDSRFLFRGLESRTQISENKLHIAVKSIKQMPNCFAVCKANENTHSPPPPLPLVPPHNSCRSDNRQHYPVMMFCQQRAAVLCCVVLCCVVLCCGVLCCVAECCVVLWCVVLCCVALCCGVLWSVVKCVAILHQQTLPQWHLTFADAAACVWQRFSLLSFAKTHDHITSQHHVQLAPPSWALCHNSVPRNKSQTVVLSQGRAWRGYNCVHKRTMPRVQCCCCCCEIYKQKPNLAKAISYSTSRVNK